MAKQKSVFTCQDCTAQFPKWVGQCLDCGAWNSLAEEAVAQTKTTKPRGYSGDGASSVIALADITIQADVRLKTDIGEFDRVLGGGLVSGSVVLIGGDPGIGKSTLLLQTSCQLSQSAAVLYVSGEESLQQIGVRAERLGERESALQLLIETEVEQIMAYAKQTKPRMMVIDSIQTLHSEALSSVPGSVSQVRECAAQLVRFAKQQNIILFLIGHVTKEGTLAGPRVLEHMVDTVLYFEGQSDSRYRLIRAMKNRFGAVNELGMFAMTEKGLREVVNPSAIFLSAGSERVAGSVVTAAWEGTRSLLVEMQALVDTSHAGQPRRITVGMDSNRLAMLLAVLHRHGGVATYDQDVFINVVGGVRLSETAADLALLFTVLSSLRDHALAPNLMVFGEVGLSGEIRPVPYGQERIKEAVKQGFTTIIAPSQNKPRQDFNDVTIHPVTSLQQALALL